MSPFTDRPSLALRSVGETKLIAKITDWLGDTNPPPPAGIGDDCAVLPPSPTEQVITVDPIVFGRHFDASLTARQAGAKLLKRNLSDIAAMGARPTIAVISLVVDGMVKTKWLEAFYRGMATCARRYSVKIVGGDISQADGVIVATLTLMGRVSSKRLLLRSGAKTGDRIYVTGKLGGSLLGHHFRFTPRLSEGAWLAAQPEVQSMMDLSDGLAKDIHALTPKNGKPSLLQARLPLAKSAHLLARKSGKTAVIHALTDGEDYELLFTLAHRANAEEFEGRWRRRFKTPLTCIGDFVTKGVEREGEIDLRTVSGYEHLR